MPSEKIIAGLTGMDRMQTDIIDVEDGIERIMGDHALYQRMLASFRATYRDGVGPIRRALADGDAILAHRYAHTLKGSSGMIGAHRLHALACTLEVALRTATGDETACLAEMAPEFDEVLAVLDRLIEGGSGTAGFYAAPARPLMQDPALLAHLIDLLLSGDGGAVDLLEEAGPSLTVILGETRLRDVTKAVNAFDYASALRTLHQATAN